MSFPLHRRKFRSYVSSVNSGRKVFEPVERWLTEKAGISVMHDTPADYSSLGFGDRLEDALEVCQSMIILITQQGIESGQVRREFELGRKQQSLHGNLFSIIPVCIEECAVPDFLQSLSYIDMLEGGFDLTVATRLLLGLYPSEWTSGGGKIHDIFISRAWSREDELTSLVCREAKRLGFQLIGNPAEQSINPDSPMRLAAGCGGGIAIIQNGLNDKAVRKITNELEAMHHYGLPFLIVIEGTVDLPDSIVGAALEVLCLEKNSSQPSTDREKQIRTALFRLQEEWINPPEPQYIFYGTDIKDEHKARNHLLQKVIQQVSTMPCLMGEGIQRGHIQGEIVNMIVHAQMMIADVSSENLNTCIEAGIAIGANVPLNLLSGGERHKPPFMFRDRQIWHYQDDLDLLGTIHKLVLPYRRHIL
jgi:hypothetical protein